MDNKILEKSFLELTDKEQKKIVSALIDRILEEFKIHDRNEIYGKTQKEMAYNSNRIEGSSLTFDQTAALFDTGTLIGSEDFVFRLKDIEEMSGHFSMFNSMLQTWNYPLSESLIKEYHYQLKAGVFEDKANGYPVGEYKNRANTVSNITTSKPDQVCQHMAELIDEYNGLSCVTLKTLAWFHARFERIHPFQDGNGRVGRIILFKECLKNGIIPILIKDSDKGMYYYALNKIETDSNMSYLEEYFKKEQEKYYTVLREFLWEYNQ